MKGDSGNVDAVQFDKGNNVGEHLVDGGAIQGEVGDFSLAVQEGRIHHFFSKSDNELVVGK